MINEIEKLHTTISNKKSYKHQQTILGAKRESLTRTLYLSIIIFYI